MIPCVAAATCTQAFETVVALSNHLASEHLTPVAMARTLAQEAAAALPTRTDPLGLDKNGIKMHVEIPDRMSQPIPPRATADESRNQEIPMPSSPTRSKQADPAACKYCARFAPDKCKRHGGRDHSTAFAGKAKHRIARACAGGGSKKPKPAGAKKAAKIDALGASRAALDRLIDTLDREIVAKTALRDTLMDALAAL